MCDKTEKIKFVLTNKIKDLYPSVYGSLLEDMTHTDVVNTNNKKAIEIYIRKKLGLNTSAHKGTKKYWLRRGWPEHYAHVKAKKNYTKRKTHSVYSREYWLNKINPVTGKNYTTEEADFERNSRRPIRAEYWIVRGYDSKTARKLADQTKTKNNLKGAAANKKKNIRNIRKATSKRSIEYYLARGYDEKFAREQVTKNQTLFSLDICIEKYGEVKGTQIWQDRQSRWKESLKNSGIYTGASKSSIAFF